MPARTRRTSAPSISSSPEVCPVRAPADSGSFPNADAQRRGDSHSNCEVGNRRERAANRVPPSRDALIVRVKEMAKKLHRQPCHKELRDGARIREDDARRIFGSYSALLRAAGFRGQVRGKDIDGARKEEMLEDFGLAIGRLGRFPTIGEYVDHGLFSYHTFKTAFKSWGGVQKEFVNRSGGSEKWPETLRELVEKQNAITYTPSPDLPICGTVLNYRAMLHEPTNEQGVVLLFGMMAEELGFIIENVRTSYPDCEGKRRVGVNSWQRVRIEFEFLSSRFKHPEDGCDLVVCWKDDLPPKGLEVIALEKILKERKEGSPEMTRSLPWGRHPGRKELGKLKALPRDD